MQQQQPRKSIMQKTAVLIAICLATAFGTMAANFVVSNGDDDQSAQVVMKAKTANTTNQAQLGPINAPMVGEEAIYLASLCASGSPNVYASRVNAMHALSTVGAVASIDINARRSDPAGWYLPPYWDGAYKGLQWFDMTTTSFRSWMGSTVLNANTAGESSHRLVIHACGNQAVNRYWCRVTSTITNIAPLLFNVATNSGNASEIAANQNFVLVSKGTNNTLESAHDELIGWWAAGGDDMVYDGRGPVNLPSQIPSYDWWVRFGASVAISVTNASELASIRSQFGMGEQSVTVELLRDDGEEGETDLVVISSITVKAALPRMTIARNGANLVRVGIMDGQLNALYDLYSTTNLVDGVWEKYSNQAFYSGSMLDVTNGPAFNPMYRFFRGMIRPQ